MRKIYIGNNKFTEVFSIDEKGAGGAYHHYEVLNVDNHSISYGTVRFQKGGVNEAGPNGLHNEDLIAIVIDRLECFQAGPFPDPHNQLAVDHLRLALGNLNDRTRERQERGVEGKSVA